MTDANQSAPSQPSSALHANIQQKQDQSYYYAHKARNTGEAPAPLPVHIPLHKSASEQALVVHETISTYQFLDEKSQVKIYIPLEGVQDLDDGSITSTFGSSTFEVLVANLKPGVVLRLGIPKLHAAIDPEQCKHRKLRNKVVVHLAKQEADSWYKLAAS